MYEKGKKKSLYKMLENKTNDDKLFFAGFDILEHNERSFHKEELLERKLYLKRLYIKSSNYFYGAGRVVRSRKELSDTYHKIISKGYEGAVIKTLEDYWAGNRRWHKIKQKDTSIFKVALIETNRDRIEIEVRQGITNGVKCTLANRKQLTKGDRVEIEHQGFLKTGLRHPVFKRKVGGEDED
jgi:hypothetical protein